MTEKLKLIFYIKETENPKDLILMGNWLSEGMYKSP
jgi:hypothetical protein